MPEGGAVGIFYVNDRLQTLHRAWVGRSRVGDQWSPGWAVIGDEPLSGSQPVAISRGMSLIDLFMVSGGALYWKSWAGLQWLPSLKVYKKISENFARAGTPAAAARRRRRIEAFVLGKDGQLVVSTG